MKMGLRTTVRFWLFLLLAVFVLLGVTAGCRGSTPAPASGPEMLIAVLNVGQADSIFVRSATGRTMLIDAAKEESDVQQVVLPFLKSHGVSSLDYLVLTHPDQDHVGGMPAVLNNGPPAATFLDSVQPGITNQSYLRTLQLVKAKGVRAVKARRGKAAVDLGAGTEVQLLEPEEPLITGGGSNNNNSIVLRVTYGSVSALLTGDLETEGEHRLLAHHDDLRSQILKVGHHGSQGATSTQFLEAVKPEVALISAGHGNPYGHPQPQLLQRLQRQHVKSYRTDLDGTIQLLIDGTGFKVITDKQGG